jgi:A/G-specific adenine glycosylase
VRDALLRWFDTHRRDLPWRRTRDPYAIWVSEVMLQQTQVDTVIPYYERFLARFPRVSALADAPLPDVLSAWRGLGYYSRARNLHRAAQQVVQLHGGELPRNVDALRTLPGFGRYTAGAVASIAFDLPAPLVDGNVARVLSRVHEVEGAPGDRSREATLWAHAAQWATGPRSGDVNQALMELGALICRPVPTCLVCPLHSDCIARRKGRTGELPPPRVRAPRKRLALFAAFWKRRGRVLLVRRHGDGLFGGLWELPTVELTGGQRPSAEPLARALGTRITLGGSLARVKRTLTHRDLTLEVYEAKGSRAPRVQSPYAEHAWCTRLEAEQLGMSTAMVRALEAAWRNGL